MRNYLLFLILTIFPAGLFSQQHCENDSIVVIKDSNIIYNDFVKDKLHPEIATIAFEATSKTRYAFDQYRDIHSKVTEYFLKYKL